MGHLDIGTTQKIDEDMKALEERIGGKYRFQENRSGDHVNNINTHMI
jgi:hypothetical protein